MAALRSLEPILHVYPLLRQYPMLLEALRINALTLHLSNDLEEARSGDLSFLAAQVWIPLLILILNLILLIGTPPGNFDLLIGTLPGNFDDVQRRLIDVQRRLEFQIKYFRSYDRSAERG